jgi:hypothetical protein
MAEAVHRAKFIYSHVAEPPLIDELAKGETSWWLQLVTEAHVGRAQCTTS